RLEAMVTRLYLLSTSSRRSSMGGLVMPSATGSVPATCVPLDGRRPLRRGLLTDGAVAVRRTACAEPAGSAEPPGYPRCGCPGPAPEGRRRSHLRREDQR